MATDSRDVSRRQFVLGLGAGLIVGGSGAAAYQTLKPAAPLSPASNTVNYGTPTGNITSPILGQSSSLAGGSFSNSTSGANRQVFLQLQFGF